MISHMAIAWLPDVLPLGFKLAVLVITSRSALISIPITITPRALGNKLLLYS